MLPDITCDYPRYLTPLQSVPCGRVAKWHITGLGSRVHMYDRCSSHKSDGVKSVVRDGGEPKVTPL